MAALSMLLVLSGCAAKQPPIPTVPNVDLARFMGDWYVLANIPLSAEKGAHNAVESYRLKPDGTIGTTFTFRDGSFDGELKRYEPTGFVQDKSNAVWGMQFFWPVKAEYLIAYLDGDYTRTIIARTRRDHVWIMARTPTIPAGEYESLVRKVGELGYDITKLQRVPQRW